MKSCPTSVATGEMQIKTTIVYHLIPFMMATIKRQIVTNVREDTEKLELSYITGWNVKWYNHFGIEFGSSSKY